eukprot:gene6632-10797_t
MDPGTAELGKILFGVRDYTFVGGLAIVFLLNVFSIVWYQARRYNQNRNLYSFFSSHFCLLITMIFFELLLMTRTVLFQAIEFYGHLQPFFNASPFILDGLFMTIFVCIVYTWNKEYFRGDEGVCATSVSFFSAVVVFINISSIAVAIVVYNVKYTPEFQQVLVMVYGFAYVSFFFISCGYYTAISLRVWMKAKQSGETNNDKIMLVRLVFLLYFFIVFALIKAFAMIDIMTNYDSIFIVVVKEGMKVFEFLSIYIALLTISVFYLHSSNVIYDRRTKA